MFLLSRNPLVLPERFPVSRLEILRLVEKAELLNKQFSSVFTNEDTESVSKITQKKYTNIGRIDVTVDGPGWCYEIVDKPKCK